MAELPSGTVTFLFTDLEGSTRLWEEFPDAMQPALARHDEILRDHVESHGGAVVKTTGEGLHAAFATAEDAVAAAVAMQVDLGTAEFDTVGSLRVRRRTPADPSDAVYTRCMQRTQIYLSDEQRRRIAELARDAAVSQAEVIRRILDRALGFDDGAQVRLSAIDATAGILPDAPDWPEWLERVRGHTAAERLGALGL